MVGIDRCLPHPVGAHYVLVGNSEFKTDSVKIVASGDLISLVGENGATTSDKKCSNEAKPRRMLFIHEKTVKLLCLESSTPLVSILFKNSGKKNKKFENLLFRTLQPDVLLVPISKNRFNIVMVC